MVNIDVEKEIGMTGLKMGSAREIFEKVMASRDYLDQWLPWVEDVKGVDDIKEYIRQANSKKCPKHDEVFEIRVGKDFAGMVALKEIDRQNKKAEVGYWLSKEYSGKGIMIRSCLALLRYAFEDLALNKIFIKCSVENIRSCNIPKQLQFTFEGIEREGEFLHNKFVDLKVYSMLKKEWLRIHGNSKKH